MNLEIDLIARYVARLLAALPAMTRPPPHLCVVEAPYYAHIAVELRRGAERALWRPPAPPTKASRFPGAFEIPAAIGFAARASGRFDGFVALGCVIRGETTHYDHICAESARGLQDLAIRDGLAIGYGILTVENEAQALARAFTRRARPRRCCGARLPGDGRAETRAWPGRRVIASVDSEDSSAWRQPRGAASHG